jgi:glyoxylase-like metal-dependent hydrolase (beta-lactamase superfamily II)
MTVMDTLTSPKVTPFFDPATGTFTYLVADPNSPAAAIIDPVLDYDPQSQRVDTHSARRVLDAVLRQGLEVQWILETHAHADHLTAAQWLKRELAFGPRVGIGQGILQVQRTFKEKLGLGADFVADGRDFDVLFAEGDVFPIGGLTTRVMATPGHTPDSVSYRIGDAVFVGDTLFAPSYGTARCDFPGGDARALHASILRLLSLADSTRLFLCHDYPPTGLDPQYLSFPQPQREQNIHLRDLHDVEAYVAMREARDATLKPPRLLEPSLRVNVRAGHIVDPAVSAHGLP